jgi:type III secretion protein R
MVCVVGTVAASGDAFASGLQPIITGLLFLLPVLALAGTSFLKISVVLLILRSAIGAVEVPPTAVVMATAAALSVFVMAPVAEATVAGLAAMPDPGADSGIGAAMDVYRVVSGPLLDFLRANATAEEIAHFRALAGDPSSTDGLRILLPAFVSVELREAFLIGVFVYLPFTVIDLITSVTLAALGLQNVSSAVVALPLKLLLFVTVDGWHKILSGLLLTYS